MKLLLAIVVVVLYIAGGIGGALAGAIYASHRADQAAYTVERGWCGILQLITSVPVNPPASPRSNSEKERSYLIYRAALERGRTLGCTPP